MIWAAAELVTLKLEAVMNSWQRVGIRSKDNIIKDWTLFLLLQWSQDRSLRWNFVARGKEKWGMGSLTERNKALLGKWLGDILGRQIPCGIL